MQRRVVRVKMSFESALQFVRDNKEIELHMSLHALESRVLEMIWVA